LFAKEKDEEQNNNGEQKESGGEGVEGEVPEINLSKISGHNSPLPTSVKLHGTSSSKILVRFTLFPSC
jgi:hypothetical protein